MDQMDAVEVDMVSDSYECQHVLLPEGELQIVYIGSGGIFAIASPVRDPEKLFMALRELLGTTRVSLYVVGAGLFDPEHFEITREYNDEELTELVNDWVFAEPPLWDNQRLLSFQERLQHADHLCRGRFMDQNGNLFLRRHNEFVPASSRSSGKLFYLTLFGGIWGLHRFAVGKLFSGFVYLCTAGFWCFGWLMDLISLFFGAFKDHEKRYILPLEHRFRKLLIFPLGLLITLVLFSVYASVIRTFLDVLNAEIAAQLRHTDPTFAIQLKTNATEFLNSLGSMFAE